MKIYEPVEHGKGYPAKIHALPISSASYHWHYDYEFLFVLKGKLELELDNKKILMEAGDFYVINSCVVHNLKNDDDENFCLAIQIDPELFHELRGNDGGRYVFYLNSRDEKCMPEIGYDIFRSVAAEIGYASLQMSESSRYRIKGLIYLLAAYMFDYAICELHMNVLNAINKEDERLLAELMDYLQIHFKEENVLDNLGKNIGFGEKTIYRFLKKHLSMTPRDLLLEIRLEEAKYLLRNTDFAIDYIAYDCGFGSENSFFRLFRNAYGITPSGYRRYRSGDKHSPRMDKHTLITKEEMKEILRSYMKGISYEN